VRLLSVGRLDPEKNPLLLPAIVTKLKSAAPQRQWRLTIVGDGPMAERVEQEIARLGVGGEVELAGYVAFGPKLESYYTGSDILLHVSHTEGLPQVLIEAMAAGLPMVATDVGGVAAAVAGTGTPLVPPDDAAAAAGALIELTSDDNRRQQLANAGLRRAADLTIEAQQRAVFDHIAAVHGRERGATQ
jgi:glycosyltransferase involved in cell wall biosynthesis